MSPAATPLELHLSFIRGEMNPWKSTSNHARFSTLKRLRKGKNVFSVLSGLHLFISCHSVSFLDISLIIHHGNVTSVTNVCEAVMYTEKLTPLPSPLLMPSKGRHSFSLEKTKPSFSPFILSNHCCSFGVWSYLVGASPFLTPWAGPSLTLANEMWKVM